MYKTWGRCEILISWCEREHPRDIESEVKVRETDTSRRKGERDRE